ncbi:MAG: 5-formyltetrahydrofolate cyclo-ligase [Gloeomargarita sp. SKYBB_i_bin120]|nr:5-formyltetrahydrofolate cyclo-ligase [Gloeomargarita sp. SKYG98]MCS7291994.1 5-formyltetrahydrofolate cyclo-ligase [Gloeomargarita sp. SKYB120]MDW8177554.1 5-formyltetrahydrofolate cyclo-ligase [Gloeomargarita sp. SKYBB_i_bin120]
MKKTLRAQFRQQRAELSPETCRQQSRQLQAYLQRHPWWRSAQQVFGYVSLAGEPDLRPLWEQAPVWGLPRREGDRLVWHRWQPGLPLTTGWLPEPFPDAPPLTPQPGDLLLLPALAYDRQGYRLGYGGGYFDRLLAEPQWQGVHRVGVVFSAFLVPVLPRDPWDQPVQAVCTEAGWWAIDPRASGFQESSPPA